MIGEICYALVRYQRLAEPQAEQSPAGAKLFGADEPPDFSALAVDLACVRRESADHGGIGNWIYRLCCSVFSMATLYETTQ